MGAASSDGRTSNIIQQEPGGGGDSPAGSDGGAADRLHVPVGFAVPTARMEGLLNAHKAVCEAPVGKMLHQHLDQRSGRQRLCDAGVRRLGRVGHEFPAWPKA
jgi:hypothetical protein